VKEIRVHPTVDFKIQLDDTQQTVLDARLVINAAGLDAPQLAARIDGLKVSYVEGSYFADRGRVPFPRLVYPVPAKAVLGVHLAFDLNGRARFWARCRMGRLP
jgi:L-2-hydroxyglutarate oxidase LhgO